LSKNEPFMLVYCLIASALLARYGSIPNASPLPGAGLPVFALVAIAG
jgi:hypothetical protein